MAERTGAPGDSTEQRRAEPELLAALNMRLGLALKAKKLQTANGSWLEIFGVSDDHSVLAEACVHQGALKSAQKQKLMANGFKLLYAETLVDKKARKIVVLADSQAAESFKKRSWVAEAFDRLDVEVVVVELAPAMKERIREAQVRQFR